MSDTVSCPRCGQRLINFDAVRNTWWCGAELREVPEWRKPVPEETVKQLAKRCLRVVMKQYRNRTTEEYENLAVDLMLQEDSTPGTVAKLEQDLSLT